VSNPAPKSPARPNARFSREFCGSPVAQASAYVILIWVGPRKAHRLKSVLREARSRCVSILRRELPFQSLLPGVSVRNAG
jgi:hypothetical protein